MDAIPRPTSAEYAPYYQKYIDLVPDEDLMTTLAEQIRSTVALLRGVPEAQGDFRYAPEKWSVKEVVGHLADVERVMAYRALRIARSDATPLAGFDENHYVAQAGFGRRPLQDLVDEFQQVRRATLALLGGLEGEVLGRQGTANNAGVSARALAYIIAGHERHHVKLLHERYGVGEATARS